MDVTRPSGDGGRDALGGMAIGSSRDPVWISLALEAKCYQPGQTSAEVKDVSRLVSRLRYRDLGFFVTTSFVGKQAYTELREDRHPVVVLSGGDIVKHLRRLGVNQSSDLSRWLEQVQPDLRTGIAGASVPVMDPSTSSGAEFHFPPNRDSEQN